MIGILIRGSFRQKPITKCPEKNTKQILTLFYDDGPSFYERLSLRMLGSGSHVRVENDHLKSGI